MSMFESLLKGAKAREAQQNYGSAAGWYQSAILELVVVAVRDHSSLASGISFLAENEAGSHVEQCVRIMRLVPESEDVGTFNTIAVAHAASLLSRHELAEYLIGRAQHPGKDFWNEFARGMNCLSLKQAYECSLGKMSGIERYWAIYLAFISDITNHRDTAATVEAMRQAFVTRNKDKRVTSGGLFEGSGRDPVQWDFRAEALKAYASYKYTLSFPA